MRVKVINGPNLNLLGTREPEIYGSDTLADLEKRVDTWAAGMGVEVDFAQTNHEGEIVELLQGADVDGIVINPGALSHTSRAIADAISSIDVPAVEVHISNIKQREQWRSDSVISDSATLTIYGRGMTGYRDAIRHLVNRRAMECVTVSYGPHPDHQGELRTGGGPLTILIHGGVFRDEFQRDTMESLAVEFTRRGHDTWNIGYRRLGSGGGWPAAGHDVAMALAYARSPWGLDRSEITVISHSAGGYLTMWAAQRIDPNLRHVALAPMSDLEASVDRSDVCAPQAAQMIAMNAPPRVAPGTVDTLVVHGERDDVVDITDSRTLMEFAPDNLITGDFGHFELLNPDHDLWNEVRVRLT